MKIVEKNGLKKIVADDGKKIRSIDDVYYKDENGEEHYPYYTTIIYLANNFDISKINELYIEEVEELGEQE